MSNPTIESIFPGDAPENAIANLAELVERVSKHMASLAMTMGRLANGEFVPPETLDLAFSTTFKFRTALDSIAADLRKLDNQS